MNMSGDKQKVAPPDYDAWAKKPCWTSLELLCLASGLDPSLHDRLHIHEIDTDSGETREIIDENAFAIVRENERLLAENDDLINRLIKAGNLRHIGDDPDYFDPTASVTCLASIITLPPGLVTAFKLDSLNHHADSGVTEDKPLEHWKMQVQAEAAKRWTSLRAARCNPTRNSLVDELAKWCRENGVKTKSGINPTPEYISRHVLGKRDWSPPTD